MSIMRGTGGGRVIPARDPEREAMSSGSGPVTTYKLSPEELEEYKKKTGDRNMARGKKAQELAHQTNEITELREERDAWRSRTEELKQAVAELQEERAMLLQTVEQAAVKLPIDDSVPMAHGILARAADHMRDRAATYDAPGGERSMGKVAAIARVLYADQFSRGEYTEEMAWGLQVVLKLVRSSQGGYRADNYEDMAAYAALMGESAGREATRA